MSDFGSGHDLMVREFKPPIWLCAEGADPASDSLSPVSVSLCPPPLMLVHSLSLKNKHKKKKELDALIKPQKQHIHWTCSSSYSLLIRSHVIATWSDFIGESCGMAHGGA